MTSTTEDNNDGVARPTTTTTTTTTTMTTICFGYQHVLIALVLAVMILCTVVGNSLIILSVVHYRRMRTFTNVLLVSLASADTLVGLLVTPIALVDLLHGHQWPFGPLICGLWATTDVLLCTASILNLCVISLDRYFAITSPLKYTSSRSRKLAFLLILGVWSVSLVICSPPWFIPEWKDKSCQQQPVVGVGMSKARSCATARELCYAPSTATLNSLASMQPKNSQQQQQRSILKTATSSNSLLMATAATKCNNNHSTTTTTTTKNTIGLQFSPLVSPPHPSSLNPPHESSSPPRNHQLLRNAHHHLLQRGMTDSTLLKEKKNCLPKRKMDSNNSESVVADDEDGSDTKVHQSYDNNNGRDIYRPITINNRSAGERGVEYCAEYCSYSSFEEEEDDYEGDSSVITFQVPPFKKQEHCFPRTNNEGGRTEFRHKQPEFSSVGPNHNKPQFVRRLFRRPFVKKGTAAAFASNSLSYQQNNNSNNSSSPARVMINNNAATCSLTPTTTIKDGGSASASSASIGGLRQHFIHGRQNTDKSSKNQRNQRIPNLSSSKKSTTSSAAGTPKLRMKASRERLMYQKERKALKTIGIVVCGFVACWLPFFILYLVDSAMGSSAHLYISPVLFDVFLWLGYSNSVLNPLIYTCYNADFRRCFRDLLSCGCCSCLLCCCCCCGWLSGGRGSDHSSRRNRKRPSVRRLHQQRMGLSG